MKKLLIICILFVCSFTANAQSATPRYGTTPNRSNTYENMTFGYKVYTDAASIDTIKLTPRAYNNEYIVNLTDTVIMSISAVSGSFRGDRMTITFLNSSGANHYVNFLGYASVFSGASKWGMGVTGTSLTLATLKSATIQFYFDGSLWNETSRVIR